MIKDENKTVNIEIYFNGGWIGTREILIRDDRSDEKFVRISGKKNWSRVVCLKRRKNRRTGKSKKKTSLE